MGGGRDTGGMFGPAGSLNTTHLRFGLYRAMSFSGAGGPCGQAMRLLVRKLSREQTKKAGRRVLPSWLLLKSDSRWGPMFESRQRRVRYSERSVLKTGTATMVFPEPVCPSVVETAVPVAGSNHVAR